MAVDLNSPDFNEYWWTVMVHEAGHAVAQMSVWNAPGSIVIRAVAERTPSLIASFVDQGGLYKKRMQDLLDPFNTVVGLAGGAMAELECLGIRESQGFAGDMWKIQNLICHGLQLRTDLSDVPPSFTAEHIAQLRKRASEAEGQLAQIREEIDRGFPYTRAVISARKSLVLDVAKVAFERLRANWRQAQSQPETVLLTSEQLSAIYLQSGSLVPARSLSSGDHSTGVPQ